MTLDVGRRPAFDVPLLVTVEVDLEYEVEAHRVADRLAPGQSIAGEAQQREGSARGRLCELIANDYQAVRGARSAPHVHRVHPAGEEADDGPTLTGAVMVAQVGSRTSLPRGRRRCSRRRELGRRLLGSRGSGGGPPGRE